MSDIKTKAQQAKKASIELSASKTDLKNKALKHIADELKSRSADIIAANELDIAKANEDKLETPLIKRLGFGQDKIEGVIEGIESLIKLDDPVGFTQTAKELDEGLELYRVTCPIGVVGIIFESRPDALVQISSLCLKSGNAVLLKGGSEAANTNRILCDIITQACQEAGIVDGWIHLLETRSDVGEMLKMDDCIDLIVPRGSNEFVQYIMNNSNIPVLGHADGICHGYVHEDADIDMAVDIITDSKCQYVSVCNAMETLLVNEAVAAEYLPKLKASLDEHKVDIRGCDKTKSIIDVTLATDEDWRTEYLDYCISIKIVSSMSAAIDHINQYGSGHTEVIVTADKSTALSFMSLCDSGNVFWNASSRFSDGFRYGLGAEVGVSTNKIHARGPVGLEGLLIYKWKLLGNGNTVAPYADGSKKFTHRKIDKQFDQYN